MVDQFHVSPATVNDAQSLSTLGAKTFSEAFEHLYAAADLQKFLAVSHSPEFYQAAIDNPQRRVFVARSNAGRLVGYAVCGEVLVPAKDPPHGAMEIQRLYVAQDAQNCGLGQRLLDACFQWSAIGHAPTVYLSVFSENTGAQRFYRRNGFEFVSEYFYAVGKHLDREFIFSRDQN